MKRFFLALGLMVLALLTLTRTTPALAQSRCPGGATNITPSVNWQAIINSSAAGTVYCLADGVYSANNIQLKDGDDVYASSLHGAILDGGYSVVTAIKSTFTPNSEANITDVIIDGIVVRRYRSSNPWNDAAIDANRGWIVRNSIFEDNTNGLTYAKPNWMCSNGAVITGNIFRNNTHVAFYWNGVDADITYNTVVNNGWGAPSDQIQWYGSTKVTNYGVPQAGFTICPDINGGTIEINNNSFVFNAAAGYWQDINVKNFNFQQNFVAFNERWGFFQEIGGGGIVRNNTFECNRSRWSQGGSWGGAEVNIISASGSTIEGNIVRVCPSGRSATIGGVTYTTQQAGRGILLLSEGRQALNNNTVRNNSIIQLGALGNEAWFVSIEQYAGSNSGNSFVGNTYYVTSLGQSEYLWFGTFRNFSTWQGTHGQDTAGSETTSAPPSGAAPTPTATSTQAVGPGTPTNTPPPTSTNTPTATTAPTTGAYSGSAAAIPGRIQAENFDWGADGVAYDDLSPGQEGGSVYRGGDVDIKTSQYGGYAVGWFETNEWLNYSVSVGTTGYYTVSVFGGTIYASKEIRIEIGGVNRTGSITIPVGTNWGDFSVVTVSNVYLPSGEATMRIFMEDGYADIAWVEFALTSGVTATPTPTFTPSNTPTPSITPTASATHTPSITPTPLPSNTPTATIDRPAVIATLDARYFGAQTQSAFAIATESAHEATRDAADINSVNAANTRTPWEDCVLQLNIAISNWYRGTVTPVAPSCP